MTEKKDYWDRPSERTDPNFCANTYALLHKMMKDRYWRDSEIVIFFYELGYTKQCDHIVDFSHHRRELNGIIDEPLLQKIQKREYSINSNERSNLDFAIKHSRDLLFADVRWNRFSLFLKLKSFFSFHKK